MTQRAVATSLAEIGQLKATVASLREALELAAFDKENLLQKERPLCAEESEQLRQTIYQLREALEGSRHQDTTP